MFVVEWQLRGNTQGNKIKTIGKKSRWLAGDDIVLCHGSQGTQSAPNLIRVTHLNIYYDTQYMTVLPGGRSLMHETMAETSTGTEHDRIGARGSTHMRRRRSSHGGGSTLGEF